MTLNDLKTGMIVKTREGKYHIIMRDFIDQGDILAGLSYDNRISNSWINLSKYNQDMTHSEIPSLDIVDVYASSVYSADTPTKLLWERKEYKEVTMQEIEEKFGGKVKIVGNEEKHNDGWIPCSERLPEEHDSMFATLKGTSKWNDAMFEKVSDDVNVTVEFEDGTRKTKTMHTVDGKWKNDSFINMEIIAWRPLPEPYKEDEEE